MIQPSQIGGHPNLPAPGTQVPELVVARLRSHARRLSWSALVLIVVCALAGFWINNDRSPLLAWVPESAHTAVLLSAAGLVVIVLVILPFLMWLGKRYTITTKRVIAAHGLISRKRQEMSHARGYAVALRRGPMQRFWGAGDLTLSNGVEPPIRLRNVANVRLVHEVLVDQVEVNQILAHRDAQALGRAYE